MNYYKMVQNAPKKSEEIMWQSVKAISDLIDELWDAHRPIAHKFMMKEYGRMYGEHFNEAMAMAVVEDMYHVSNDGKRIEGEAVPFEEASTIAPSAEMQWDAYVGVNALAHDLARLGMGTGDIKKLAKAFWFEDADFEGESKVFWYFANK